MVTRKWFLLKLLQLPQSHPAPCDDAIQDPHWHPATCVVLDDRACCCCWQVPHWQEEECCAKTASPPHCPQAQPPGWLLLLLLIWLFWRTHPMVTPVVAEAALFKKARRELSDRERASTTWLWLDDPEEEIKTQSAFTSELAFIYRSSSSFYLKVEQLLQVYVFVHCWYCQQNYTMKRQNLSRVGHSHYQP